MAHIRTSASAPTCNSGPKCMNMFSMSVMFIQWAYGNLLTLEYLTRNCILVSHIHTLDIRPAINSNFLYVLEVQFLKYGMPDLANRDVKYEFFC